MLSSHDITLKPLQETDILPMATLANNYKIWKMVRDRLPYPYTVQDAADFVCFTQAEDPILTLGIFYQDALAGVTSLMPQDDIHRLNAELGYWIGEPFWNKGIATTAVRLMVSYAFDSLLLHRLFAGVFHTNPASMKVLEHAGFQLECIAREAVIKEGMLLDEHRYVLIKK